MQRFWPIAWPTIVLVGCSAAPLGLPREATGVVGQTLCSKVFLAGLAPEEVYREHLHDLPGMWLADWALRYAIDRARQEVGASIAGGYASRSVYRAGRGCTLAYPGRPLPDPLVAGPHAPTLLAPIAGPGPVYPGDARLRNAIDAAFAEPATGPRRATKAVVIVHEDRVIAERYAPGYRLDTPLLSHSVAKSVVNSLVGILTRQGKLQVSDPAPVAAWHGEHDPRGAITIDHLLRMNAGFDFDEGVFPSPAAQAWYTDPDTARVAEQAALKSPVGRSWAYSSLSYAVLSRIIGDTVGGGPQGLHDFAQRELFDPLGMTTVTLEFDASGTMMGAQAMFATARDWARFGLLYLHDGLVAGTRILPEGWVDYSTKPTVETGYGAGFWLNWTKAAIPEWGIPWGLPHAPSDAFMARGYLGQYVVIVPSQSLVVVRFGLSHGRNADADSVGRLVRDVIDALAHAP